MEFPSSGGRRMVIDEFDTGKHLAHAKQQTEARGLDRLRIVDVDHHINELASYSEIISLMEDEVARHAALATRTRSALRSIVPRDMDFDDSNGRIMRIGLASLEKAADNIHPAIVQASRAMDAMGIDVACLLPSTVLRVGMQPKKDLELALASAYNRWLTEVLLPLDSRMRGFLYLPLSSSTACHQAITKYGDKPGVVGAVISSPRHIAVHDNAYGDTYAAMAERNLVLAFHSGANWFDGTTNTVNRYAGVLALGGPHWNSVHMTNWLMNGMPERFPQLKLLWLESGIAWIPALMMRLDDVYMRRSFEAPALRSRPSDYMRQMYYCSHPLEHTDDSGMMEAIFRMIGADTQLLWGSNYPGNDFDLPSRIYDLPFLSEQGRRNILGENAAKLFR